MLEKCMKNTIIISNETFMLYTQSFHMENWLRIQICVRNTEDTICNTKTIISNKKYLEFIESLSNTTIISKYITLNIEFASELSPNSGEWLLFFLFFSATYQSECKKPLKII